MWSTRGQHDVEVVSSVKRSRSHNRVGLKYHGRPPELLRRTPGVESGLHGDHLRLRARIGQGQPGLGRITPRQCNDGTDTERNLDGGHGDGVHILDNSFDEW